MISNIRKILNTKVVLLNEKQKKVLFDILFKVLKSNIFIFFIFGTILSILLSRYTNWDNFNGDRAKEYWIIHIELILYNFIPFFVAIILNLIIKFSKNEKVKKVFKIIMIITNVLSVIYLLLLAFMIYAVAHMFDNSSVSLLINSYNIKCI